MADLAILYGDSHVPQHNVVVMDLLKKVHCRMKPDYSINTGDMLNLMQFSTHSPTWGEEDTQYEDDLKFVTDYFDYTQKYTQKRTVMVEGNHEYRIARWAARTCEGRGAFSMLSPRINISRGRKAFTYIPYGNAEGQYPHYKLNNRVVVVHGWSYAKNATALHLTMSQGKSVIHGHTHRGDKAMGQKVWGQGVIQAMSTGCTCQLIPVYGCGAPVTWVNTFIIGYLGRRSDTFFQIPIHGNFCILPDGTEVRV